MSKEPKITQTRERLTSEIIGQPLSAVENSLMAKGVAFRVVHQDGKDIPSSDYKYDWIRANLHVNGGIVTKVGWG